ncbi:MAG: guanylate kinase [Patescibacteria group bacterium]|jgi:guanylate kinase
MKIRDKLFIISGPSGAGEDSVIEGLRNHFDIERVITTTTREKRKGESEGNPYYFVSKKDFKSKIKKGEFIEYAEEYNGNFYGTPKKELERVKQSNKIGIWKIEYKGVQIVKKKLPNVKSIYIAPPDLKTLENRIKKRSKVDDVYIAERMKYTKQWLKYEKIYDFKVVNQEGKLDQTIIDVKNIIKKQIGSRVGSKIVFFFLATLVLIGYFVGFGFFHLDSRDQIVNYYKKTTASYGIKNKEQSFAELLKFVPKDSPLAYVVGPMKFDFFSGGLIDDFEVPTYQYALFFYPKSELLPGVVLKLDDPKSAQWGAFKQLVAQIWAKKFPEKVPLTLPDGTVVYELVPKPENIEPITLEYKGETIYELADGAESTIAYAMVGDYVVVSSSSQNIRLAILASSDISQRQENTQYSRCSGNNPYQYIAANSTIDLENSDLFLNILPKTAFPAKYCI